MLETYKFALWALMLLFLPACQAKQDVNLPLIVNKLTYLPEININQVWPVLDPLNVPNGLRACCVFGYNQSVELWGLPVPFYHLSNIVDSTNLGEHTYNDSLLRTVVSVSGIAYEKNGIIYTEKSGFIDISHIRDTIDYTLFLFSHIYPNLGKRHQIVLSPEILNRRIQFFEFPLPEPQIERYKISAYLAASLAYQLAAWHEVAQWYGYRSVPGFSEEISAFSPEDLYSNSLGARIALDLILQGYANNHERFNLAVTQTLPPLLNQLGAVTPNETKSKLDVLDGIWWDSSKRVPQKFSVLYRNYDLSSDRMPERLLEYKGESLRLALPLFYDTYKLSESGELQLFLSDNKQLLGVNKPYLTFNDLFDLAEQARKSDIKQLAKLKK